MNEVYTLGSRKAYQEALATFGEDTKKLGPRTNHDGKNIPGAMVFPTIPIARLWAKMHKQGWVAFQLEGSWSDDVQWENETPCYRLKRDLKIIGEVE